MALKLTNNAVSTLAASIIATDTAISVQPADAGKFPTLTAGDWFPITIIAADGSYEILKCTARASAVLTVERGQEGTTAKPFDAGARIDLRLTAGALAEKLDGATLSEADAKASVADGDQFILLDSAASNAIKRSLWSTIKATLKTYFDTLYATAAHVHAAATTSVAGFMSAADKSKLDGIASGATANSSDATLLARANHTGTQAISTVSGLQTALDGKQPVGSYAASSHTHDDRYYTEAEVNSLLAGKAASSHDHNAADITSGTLAVARGGTGATSTASAPWPLKVTDDILPVGVCALMYKASGGTLANGSTTAGSNLRTSYSVSADGMSNIGATQSGTWENVTGSALNDGSVGLFARIS